MKSEQYFQNERLAFDATNQVFLWGPEEYPLTSNNNSFTFWDETVIPLRLDGVPYYNPNLSKIEFYDTDSYYSFKYGRPMKGQRIFDNSKFVFMMQNTNSMYNENGLPKTMNDPFDKDTKYVNLDDLLKELNI